MGVMMACVRACVIEGKGGEAGGGIFGGVK